MLTVMIKMVLMKMERIEMDLTGRASILKVITAVVMTLGAITGRGMGRMDIIGAAIMPMGMIGAVYTGQKTLMGKEVPLM